MERLYFQLVAYDDDLVSIEEIIETINGTGYKVESAVYYDTDVIVDAGPDQTAYEGDTVTLDGTRSSKPIGEFLAYEWSQTKGPVAVLSDAKAAQPIFTAPDVSNEGESLEFRLTYTDTDRAEYSDSTAVFVMNAPVIAHTELTSAEARDMIKANSDAVVIDVREEIEYCSIGGHVPSALNYPWNSGVFQEKHGNLPTDVPILIICRSGNRSHQAANYLDSLGFTSVFDIGGMNTWEGEVEICEGAKALSVSITPETISGIAPFDVVYSATADGGMGPYSYTWDFGDGTTAAAGSQSHAYSNPGIYTAQLSVKDANGATVTKSASVTVSENTSPVADAGQDRNAGPGESVILDGSGSHDNDGDLLTYHWEQSESDAITVSIANVESPTAGFMVPNGGANGYSLTFRLTVTDEQGLASADEIVVTVGSDTPVEKDDGGGSSCFVGVLTGD